MFYKEKGVEINVIGEQQLCKLLGKQQQIALIQLLWPGNNELTGQLYDLQMLSSTLVNEWVELDELLDKYKGIFEEPKRLPLMRFQDYQIVLKEGVQPINLRPYRYGWVQNDVIEKMVKDMLKIGAIKVVLAHTQV